MYLQIKRISLTLLASAFCFAIYAQKTLRGTVKDANGEPMIGVSIQGVGGVGAVTDLDGNFSIANAEPSTVLKISYVGYKPQTVKVGNRSALDIIMQEESNSLNELVVVGYGTMRKRDLTGSIASVNSEKLNARGTTTLGEALQGSVPGVSITQTSSRPGGSFDVQIRGQASINKQSQPLYVIDGIVCSSMDFLNPNDIERLDVLKDASSTAIYG